MPKAVHALVEQNSSTPATFSPFLRRISEAITRVAEERSVLIDQYRVVFAAQKRIDDSFIHKIPKAGIRTMWPSKWSSFEKVMKSLDAHAWRSALYEGGLSALMNHDQLAELERQFIEDCPEATEENMARTFSAQLANAQQVFVEGALSLFSGLDGSYVRNDRICLGKRIILKGLGDNRGSTTWGFGNDANRINDLNRVLMVLSGEDPTQITIQDQPSQVLQNAKRKGEYFVDFNHIECRLFKNGNVHVTIKNELKVEWLNDLIAHHYGSSLGYRK